MWRSTGILPQKNISITPRNLTPIKNESWAMRGDGDHESNLMGWEASTLYVDVGKEALEHETDIK